MNKLTIKLMLIIQILVLVTALPCVAEDICFKNRADGTIKTECYKSMGRHGAFFEYKCYNKEGVPEVFEPGDEWTVVNIRRVCFEYAGKDDSLKEIKGCIEIKEENSDVTEYRCFDDNKNMYPFEPGNKWREIGLDDERCEPWEWKDVFKGGTSKPVKNSYVKVKIFYGTDRNQTGSKKPVNFYGGKRGKKLVYGTCEVSIPKNHKLGELETPRFKYLSFIKQFKEKPEKHVILTAVNQQSSKDFFKELGEAVKQSDTRQAFVFIHGYNVTFEDAARRTAQMSYDLNFDGGPVLYSWPSAGKEIKYMADEDSVEWTIPHLKEFLEKVAEKTGAERIHLIAHSMGNRALTKTLLRFADNRNNKTTAKFREIILTAPDIDAEIFKRDIAPVLASFKKRITLYASSDDLALTLSKKFHGNYPRAGDAGDGLVIVPGIDTIDATAVDTSIMGHSYHSDERPVLSDIYYLLNSNLSPSGRFGLEQVKSNKGMYWFFAK